MKKYIVKNVKTQEVFGEFKSKSEASEEMLRFIDERNEDVDSDDEEYLTPFDFTLEETEVNEVCDVITDFEEARKALGGKSNSDFKVSKTVCSKNSVKLEDVTQLVQELNPKHMKAMIAFNRLATIAQAWNEADGFVPDFGNSNQSKYFPWFEYDRGHAGFFCAYSYAYAYTYFGFRLCFKTRERAAQFGKQFIDLWNDFLLG